MSRPKDGGSPAPDSPTPSGPRPSASWTREDSALSSNQRRTGWLIGIVLAGAIASVWLVFALLPRWLNTTAITGTPTPTTAAADTRRIRATLFYVSESGDTLDPVDREVPYAATQVEQARRILDTEFGPAPQGLVSPIPAGTAVRSVFLTPSGNAYVDLTPEIVTAHTGGSLDEALTVFAIVNALTVNMPAVTGVQILVNGKQVDSLVGHLDLRRPLARSMQWVKKDNKE